MTIDVRLLDPVPDPLPALYLAYRTCYSALTPQQIDERIDDGRITSEQLRTFVEQRLEAGHVSPLEQVWFRFAISGVSRAFSHQFVRHRAGLSLEQQSQRFVTFKDGRFPYTTPDTIRERGLAPAYDALMATIANLYSMLLDEGVPGEDARFVLPNATNTNLTVTINFAALLHMADLRLCTRAQWEFRRVVSLMRAAVYRAAPDLARHLQPKCGELRQGYCDESIDAWAACPIGKKRPHKSLLFAPLADIAAPVAPLEDGDFHTIETEP